MSDAQTNGESIIITTDKPVENSTFSGEISTAGTTSDTPIKQRPRRVGIAAFKYGDEHLSNLKKQRYWNSWEELYMVELWRRYRDEVTIINVPLPVYRKMMVAMRSRNMIVTAQDCRRKINTLNARYKQELKRIETTGCKSDWRLFPLIHCVLQPKIKEYDPWHENKIIKKLLDKLPKPVEEKPPPSPPPSATSIINNSNHQPSLHTYNFPPIPTLATYQQQQQQQQYQQRYFPTVQHTNPTIPSYLTADITLPSSSLEHKIEKPSILPFHNITLEKIEQLRQDNNRLAAQRDDDLKRLHMEEDNFRCFENFIRLWTEQKELELRRVQLLTQQNVLNVENGDNHNMEPQLQETVAAK